MKENSNIKLDDVFKEVFEDFEATPSTKVWHNISENIPQYAAKPKTAFFKWSAAVFIITLIISSILFFQKNNDTNIITQRKATNKNTINNKTSNSLFSENTIETTENFTQNNPVNTIEETNSNYPQNTNAIAQTHTPANITKSSNNHIEETIPQEKVVENITTPEIVERNVQNTESEDVILALNVEQEEIANVLYNEIEETTESISTLETPINNYELSTPSIKTRENFVYLPQKPIATDLIQNQSPILQKTETQTASFYDYAFKPNWTIGIHFASENIRYEMNTSPKNMNFSHNYTMSLAYNKKDYFIESGLIYSKIDDNGDYYVNYTSYDPIGSYLQVDSISIIMEDTVQYHTSDVMVYDSIEHVSYSKTKHLYHYISVPILVGYKWHMRNVDFGIKAGFAYQFQILEEKPDVLSNYSEMQVNGLTNLTPKRFETNSYVTSSAFMHYYMSERMILSVEPTLRYYTRSFYKNYFDTKNPYSLSLRIGLLYKL